LFETQRPSIDFKIVYIRDSHPVLGFRAPTNDRRDIGPDQEPRNLADREQWACADRKKMACTIPVVMDTFDDRTLKAYDAFPQRIVVIDRGGKIVHASSGLAGFELETVTRVVRSLER
jgi:hypothetical protein